MSCGTVGCPGKSVFKCLVQTDEIDGVDDGYVANLLRTVLRTEIGEVHTKKPDVFNGDFIAEVYSDKEPFPPKNCGDLRAHTEDGQPIFYGHYAPHEHFCGFALFPSH